MNKIYSKSPTIDDKGNRLYYCLGIYVSRDGKELYSIDNGGKHYYQRKTGAQKEPFIEVKGKKHSIAYIVAKCYKPAPKDGKTYSITHIDGNLDNCDISNLKWEVVPPKVYTFNHDPQTKLKILCTVPQRILIVHKNGDVFEKGNKNKLAQYDSIYDSDTDLEFCIGPFVYVSTNSCIYRKRISMDVLMEEVGYIQGTKDDKKSPKILHIDHDPNNYDSSNLEWVEENSPEYIAYRKDEVNQIRNRNIQLNPSKTFPEFMQPKI